jgi:uncharacterized short protein YbdD (DUF466 family)
MKAGAHLVRRAWCWLRQVSGDDAYERYRAHLLTQHAASVPLTRAQFCAQQQERKWSGISRCC